MDNMNNNHNNKSIDTTDRTDDVSRDDIGGCVAATTTMIPSSSSSSFWNDAVVHNNETILLHFVDGRQIFAFCSNNSHNHTTKKKSSSSSSSSSSSMVRINKRNYSTSHFIGLPYGTIVELQQPSNQFVPLPPSAKLIPDLNYSIHINDNQGNDDDDDDDDTQEETPRPHEETTGNTVIDGTTGSNSNSSSTNVATANASAAATITATISAAATTTTTTTSKDNRHLVDTNTAQLMDYNTLLQMRLQNYSSQDIIASLLHNSTTYATKTTFAQEKYILRKQMKHQVRCRIVRCHTATIVEALYKKDSKKYMNVRDDTIGQLLSYANICSGTRTMIYDDNYGIIMSSIAERMNGYGIIYAIYDTQQPSYQEMFTKFNLSFTQINIIQFVHTSDVFYDTTTTSTSCSRSSTDTTTNNNDTTTAKTVPSSKAEEIDYERMEREKLLWPCTLQDHTRQYILQTQQKDTKTTAATTTTNTNQFLIKRASRFARKLCRTTNREVKQSLQKSSCHGVSEHHHQNNNNDDNNHPRINNTSTTNVISKDIDIRLCDSLILVTKYDPTMTLLQLFPYLAPSAPYVIYCEYIEPLTECFKQIQTNPALLSINLRLSDTWMREYQILPNRTHPAMSMSQSGGFILTGIKLHPIYGQNEFNEEQLKEIREEIGGGRRARSNRKKPSQTPPPPLSSLLDSKVDKNSSNPIIVDTTSNTTNKNDDIRRTKKRKERSTNTSSTESDKKE